MKFDLHVHTNHSDGIYSPKEVLDLARKIDLSGIAITDHDTTSGLKIAIEYSKQFNDIKIIPGIEFSCVWKKEEVHILGYYIDYNNPDLIELTKTIKDSRRKRGIRIIEKINNLGLNLSIDDVKRFAKTDFLGRDHIARALTYKGYANNTKDAFEKYLKLGGPAYVKRYKITIEETINLIKELGGVPVLAHPGYIKNKDTIKYCIEKGIEGLEAIHSGHSKKDIFYLLKLAKENNLITTGGSDFHGDRGIHELLLGKYYVGKDTILQLEEMV